MVLKEKEGLKEHGRIVRFLCDPGSYPHDPESVEHIETHISHVFLSGPFAYKLKKPVKFDFLDFSTRSRRHRACLDEVRLNRRLAPHVYLGVKPVTRDSSGGLKLGGRGTAADWLVWMRRLPAEQTLEARHRRGELSTEDVDRLAERLYHFHASIAPANLSPLEYRERCASHVSANRRELLAVSHHLPRFLIERIHAFQLQLLALRPEWFENRVLQGCVVEGHGDLRPEHICFTDPISIFDCLEFSRDLRNLDVADELGFLAAECDYLGASWAGERILRRTEDLSGDIPPPELAAFYRAYRACVRAKVSALRADQLGRKRRSDAADQAVRYLELADGYLRRWAAPMLIVVGGLSGTGKSTLAARVSLDLGLELLRTDVIRRELFGASSHSTAAARDRYSAASRARVYDEMLGRALTMLSNGVSVALDGTFSRQEPLDRALRAVGRSGVALAVECACRPGTALERIRRRLQESHDESEAGPDIYERQDAEWQPWPESIPAVRVDTETPLAMQTQTVFAALRDLQDARSRRKMQAA